VIPRQQGLAEVAGIIGTKKGQVATQRVKGRKLMMTAMQFAREPILTGRKALQVSAGACGVPLWFLRGGFDPDGRRFC
jgi:hypothetical protein